MRRDPEAMIASRVRRLPETTGKSLEEWASLLDAALPGAPFAEKQRRLVERHGLGAAEAREIIHLAAYEFRPADEEMVAAQYEGAKAALRPIYDAVIDAVHALGDDVEIAPRRTYVTLARGRQFGIVQASTRTRVDLGLRLDDEPPTERLAAAGSFGSGSITHRVGPGRAGRLDDQVRAWLRAAYDCAGSHA
jgi:hypothetical protein